MSDDPKAATAIIAKEVVDALPPEDKAAAGRAFGATLVNVTEAARDLTAVVAGIASLPAKAARFAVRMANKWRQLPPDRRLPLAPKLLLEASTGYAAAPDDELRTAFERLVTASFDRETAPRVHPSFASAISQMTPLDARFIRLIMDRPPVFSSFAALGAQLGPGIDFVEIGTSAANLKRLGLVDASTPTIVDDMRVMLDDPKDWSMRFGEVRVEEGDKIIMRNDGVTEGGHTLRVRYRLTELGLAFDFVVSPPR